MARSGITSTAAGCAWILDLLYRHEPQVTWAPAGQLPPGYRLVSQFAMLPGGGERAFLVSLGSRRGAASALTSYAGLRPASRRAVRLALGLALRAGAAGSMLGPAIDIGVLADARPRPVAGVLIDDYLADLLGQDRVVIAFGGAAGPYRKPVLQVFTTAGRPAGYVKIGWNDWSRDAVSREADALRACAAGPGTLGAPGLVHRGRWNGLDLVVTAPLPAGVRRPGPELPSPATLRAICELSPTTTSALADSLWWQRLGERIGALPAGPAAEVLARTADRLACQHGEMQLEFGRWHGDLVPWNLAVAGSRRYAWDWEGSAASAPVGFDAVHFGFQVAFVARRVPLAESVARAGREAAAVLAALDVPAQARGLLSWLHLTELAVRHEEARASTGDADGKFFPAVLTLLDRQCEPERLAGLRTRGRAA